VAINPRVLQALGQCPNMTFHYKEAICGMHNTLPLYLLTAAAVAVAFLSSDIEILSHILEIVLTAFRHYLSLDTISGFNIMIL
jgi:hypothetical protein